jgi:Fe-S-cluster-containing dehydrogenase component/CRP-like cAMP-binding protein
MSNIISGKRPSRWDKPFDPNLSEEDLDIILSIPAIKAINKDCFPSHMPLKEIIRNDTKLRYFNKGEIIINQGTYDNTAFLVIAGKLRVVLEDLLKNRIKKTHKPKTFNFFSKFFKKNIPEYRQNIELGKNLLGDINILSNSNKIFIQDIPTFLESSTKSEQIGAGAIFGELAALGRVPRTATIFSETESILLEIRWQGLREFRKYDDGWKKHINDNYRKNSLNVVIRETSLFNHLNKSEIQEVAESTLFETYGTFDWSVSYQKLQSLGKASIEQEPIILSQGGYPDGVLLIRNGFARVFVNKGNGNQTITYLSGGQSYGLDELYRKWNGEKNITLNVSISAISYVDILRIPTYIIEKHVFPFWKKQRKTRNNKSNKKVSKNRISDFINRTMGESSFINWTVKERLMNGNEAMLIDLDKCTRCDDCVEACAMTHDGNPRFVRQGKIYNNIMIANACMHCKDPVCLIGCPTGAINRNFESGNIIINENTCIGCQTCANSCPYSNIQMVTIKNDDGFPILNPVDNQPTIKATKCDLCIGQNGGPACVNACPTGALTRMDMQKSRFIT